MRFSSEQMLDQFRHYNNLLRREYSRFRDEIVCGRLSHSQGLLLSLLVENDGLTQKELSTQLRIRPASLGELVDKLEKMKYVKRQVNEKDKRFSNVYLLDEGRKVFKEIIQAKRIDAEDIFSILSEDEKNQLSALMTKLIRSLEKNSVS